MTLLPQLNKKAMLLSVALVLILLAVIFIFQKINISKQNRDKPDKTQIFYPGAPYAKNQLIVKYKDSYTLPEIVNLKNTLEALGVVSQKKVFDSNAPDLKNIYVLTFKQEVDVKVAAERLSNLSEVEAVGANYLVKTQELPNDPAFSQQTDFYQIHLPEAWDLTHGSNTVTAAIVDTGIDYNHEDFSGRTIIKGPDFSCLKYDANYNCISSPKGDDPMDNNGHGTHVAGVIGAVSNNGVGMAGENWNITLLAVKAMNQKGESDTARVTQAIKYAADRGAKVMNLSLSSSIPCSSAFSYRDAINYAISKGVIVVAAAGNGKNDNGIAHPASEETPASCDGVLTVGSVDSSGKRAPSSNYGPRVNIAAPGVNIISTVVNGYGYKNGTSMATPHVAGIAALLLSVAPNLSSDQIKQCLTQTADPLQTDYAVGPLLNAYKALKQCSVSAPKISPTQTQISPFVTSALSPTTVVSNPPQNATPTVRKPSPTPTPPQTYTCHEKDGTKSAVGTIQIGDLVCTPNF